MNTLFNSVNRKALLIVAFVFLLSFILIITSFWFKGSMKEVYALIGHANKVDIALQDIHLKTKDSESDMRAYVITHQQSYYDDYLKNKKSVQKQLHELHMLLSDSVQLSNCTQLGEHLEERFLLLDNMAFLIDSFNISKFQKIINKGENVSKEIDVYLTTMAGHERKILSQHERELFSLMDLRQKVSIFGGVLSMVLGVLIFKFIQEESESIQKRQELLQELNDNKDKFFSIISHDLKNPFSAIKAFIEMLNDRDYSKDKNTIIKMLHSSSQRFDMLLNNLLTWARLQMNGIVVNREKINMNGLLDQVLEYYKVLIESKGLGLEINAEKTVYALADKAMTETVLRNLISNAVKFTDKGKITLSVYHKINKIVIEVTDTGIGMSESVLQNIFQLGKIQSTKGTRNETGTGMGLILCKDMAERQGGRLEVSSTSNGTAVKLILNET